MIATAITQAAIFLILGFIGFLAAKFGILTDHTKEGLNNLLLNIATPALIISSLHRDYTPERAKGLAYAFLLCLIYYAVAIGLSRLSIRKSDQYDYRVLRYAATYPNCGYIGLPLVQGILGSEAVFYVSVAIMTMNLLAFTHGVALYRGDDGEKKKLREFFSPIIVSIFIGLAIFLFRIPVPAVISEPIDMLAQANTPVAMLIAGSLAYQIDIRHLTNVRQIIKGSLLKLIVIPLIFMLALRLIPGNSMIKLVAFITSSCSTATTTMMLAIRYKRDELLAVNLIAVTTVLCAVTIPLLLALAGAIGLY